MAIPRQIQIGQIQTEADRSSPNGHVKMASADRQIGLISGNLTDGHETGQEKYPNTTKHSEVGYLALCPLQIL